MTPINQQRMARPGRKRRDVPFRSMRYRRCDQGGGTVAHRDSGISRVSCLFFRLRPCRRCPVRLRAQGIALSGVGPVNRSMGGAATAAPIDAAGALMWNPASISGLCIRSRFGHGTLVADRKALLELCAFGLQGSTAASRASRPFPNWRWYTRPKTRRGPRDLASLASPGSRRTIRRASPTPF